MRLEYDVTGEDRKRLVAAISGILGVKPRYTGIPKCAFVIGCASVDREGSVTFGDGADHVVVEDLVSQLAEMGFINTAPTAAAPTTLEKGVAAAPTPATTPEKGVPAAAPATTLKKGVPAAASQDMTTVAEKDVVMSAAEKGAAERGVENDESGTTISVPRALFTDQALNNLRKMVRVKEPLLRKALATDRVEIEVTEETVGFPWFGELDAEELKSYTQFIEKLCRFAITSKRITSKERRVDNERFSMRTWLIRLGCSGEEYKALRKRMLENLTGDAAWRFGRPS